MKRREFFLASATVMTTVSSASGHMIAGRGRCNSPTCYMCTHNNAHRSGRQHDRNGDWGGTRGYGKTSQIAARNEKIASEPVFSTPINVIDSMLKILYPRPSDVLCDLGCGDGRICIQAAKTYGCIAIGIEKDRELVLKARQRVADAGLTSRVVIRSADILDTSLLTPTMFTMYLYSDLMEKVLPKIQHAHTIASIHHELEEPDLKFTVSKTPIYMKRNIA